MEQFVDTALIVPSLDVLVPQMDDQLLEVCRQLDTPIPEQVIEVPSISSPSHHCRRRVRFAEQTAEQLVEVPMIISCFSLLQWTVEQNVDIPVLGREWRNVGLQGFPPRQSSTVQLASQERSSERIVEQIVDSPVLGGGLQDFRAASSSSSREHAGEGVFRTFPRGKKSPKLGSHSGSELLPESSPSTLSAHSARRWWTPMAMRGCVWTLRGALSGRTWILGINNGARLGSTEVPQIQFIDFVVMEAELEYIIMRQSTEAFGILSVPLGLLALFALGKWCIVLLLLVSGSLFSVSGCCNVEYGTLDFSGDDFVRGAMLGLTVYTGLATVLGFGRISHIFYVDVGSDFSVFLSQNGEVCSVDASI